MKNIINLSLFILLLTISRVTYAQPETVQWKLLMSSQQQSIWYDDTSIDTLGNSKINIWVQQLNNPFIEIEGLHGKIYRSLTQYAIDLKVKKYGILKIVYYDSHNKKIYNFNYHIDNFADKLKYSYPASTDTVMKELISRFNIATIK
jgi:hypothetical protein